MSTFPQGLHRVCTITGRISYEGLGLDIAGTLPLKVESKDATSGRIEPRIATVTSAVDSTPGWHDNVQCVDLVGSRYSEAVALFEVDPSAVNNAAVQPGMLLVVDVSKVTPPAAEMEIAPAEPISTDVQSVTPPPASSSVSAPDTTSPVSATTTSRPVVATDQSATTATPTASSAPAVAATEASAWDLRKFLEGLVTRLRIESVINALGGLLTTIHQGWRRWRQDELDQLLDAGRQRTATTQRSASTRPGSTANGAPRVVGRTPAAANVSSTAPAATARHLGVVGDDDIPELPVGIAATQVVTSEGSAAKAATPVAATRRTPSLALVPVATKEEPIEPEAASVVLVIASERAPLPLDALSGGEAEVAPTTRGVPTDSSPLRLMLASESDLNEAEVSGTSSAPVDQANGSTTTPDPAVTSGETGEGSVIGEQLPLPAIGETELTVTTSESLPPSNTPVAAPVVETTPTVSTPKRKIKARPEGPNVEFKGRVTIIAQRKLADGTNRTLVAIEDGGTVLFYDGEALMGEFVYREKFARWTQKWDPKKLRFRRGPREAVPGAFVVNSRLQAPASEEATL